MHGPVVAGHAQEAAVAVEVDAEYVCRLGAPPELRDDGARGGVEHPDQRPLGARSRHLTALQSRKYWF